jgi:hypothetical protein
MSHLSTVEVALRLRNAIRDAIPNIDGKCHAAGAACECLLCLADELGRRTQPQKEPSDA